MCVFNRINSVEYLFTFNNTFISVCISINTTIRNNNNNTKEKKNGQKCSNYN